jgi:hypothetical protein
MTKLFHALRSVLAVSVGYVVIALGTTLTFEVWLGGIGYYKSSAFVLALATLGALASGFAGGLVAAWLAGRRPFLHAAAILLPIALDTTYVITSGISDDPVWFDLGGGASLVVAALFAGYLMEIRGHSGKVEEVDV